MAKPHLTNAAYYDRYIQLVTEDDLALAFKNRSAAMAAFLNTLPEAKADFAYAPGKWTIKQLLQHMVDAERIFAYRALAFARHDVTPLPGFEEDDYAKAAGVSGRSIINIAAELMSVRHANQLLFASFAEEDLQQVGTASNNPMSAASAGWVILGHFEHHKAILLERYL